MHMAERAPKPTSKGSGVGVCILGGPWDALDLGCHVGLPRDSLWDRCRLLLTFEGFAFDAPYGSLDAGLLGIFAWICDTTFVAWDCCFPLFPGLCLPCGFLLLLEDLWMGALRDFLFTTSQSP